MRLLCFVLFKHLDLLLYYYVSVNELFSSLWNFDIEQTPEVIIFVNPLRVRTHVP